MSRIFLSHASRDTRQAIALERWLVEQEPTLADEIFLAPEPDTGIRPGERWKEALQRANGRCEAVICLLSTAWEASPACETEYRYAQALNKAIVCARLEPRAGGITDEWQRCDLFGDGPTTAIVVDGEPVMFATEGLRRLLDGLRSLRIGAEHFPWPPQNDPERAPYRGWEPFDEDDAAVFFGRDTQILRGLDALRGMRASGTESLLVILGPPGAGKSSFLRAGLLPRLRRDDRHFLLLDIVRPERAVLTGDRGLAHAIHALRTRLGLPGPTLGEITAACSAADIGHLRVWLAEARQVAEARLLDLPAGAPPPTLILPLDQGEELFGPDAGPEAPRFLALLTGLLRRAAGIAPALLVAVTIRTDRYQALQSAPELAGVRSVLFDELEPMPPAQYTQVVTGPATRAGRPLRIELELVNRLLADRVRGADTLPLLALTLARLYRDHGDDGDLTLDDYEKMGAMPEVVQHEIDALLTADPTERRAQLETLHAAFIPWLATIDPDTDRPIRRLARRSALLADAHPLIEAFVEKRLLLEDDRDGEIVVAVAQESLLRQWHDLAGWLRLEREDLADADRVQRAATDWAAHGRDEVRLLEGTRLADAETLATKPGFRDRFAPSREFLHASRKRENARLEAEQRLQEAEQQAARDRQRVAEELAASAQAHAVLLRNRSRVLRGILAVMLVIVTLAVFGLVKARTAQQQADTRIREATALRLVSEAQSMLAGARDGGDVRALQQILAAQKIASSPDEGALFDAVITRRDTLKIIETTAPVWSVVFGPDGHRIASGGADGTVWLWDAATGQPLGQPLTGHRGPVYGVAFSPDGQRIASGGADGTVRLWDAATGHPFGLPLTGHRDQVTSVAFSPDGQRIASAGLDDTVRMWNTATGRSVGLPMTGHQGAVSSMAFSPDGHRIASAGADGTVWLWDAATGQPLGQPLTGNQGAVSSVVFSPDGQRIASGGEGTVRVWDAATGQPVGQPMGHEGTVFGVAFSPDGQRIVSGSALGTVRVWDAATGQPLGQPLTGHHGSVRSVAFSPDGQRIASGSLDSVVRLWDVATEPLTGHRGPVYSVAFGPGGQRIASAGADETVRLWDTATGQPIGQPLTGHQDQVTSVAFGPDGQRIVSGGWDRTVRLWDAATGQPIGAPMTGHQGPVLGVAFSPDGQRIVSGSGDGTVWLWDAATGQPIGAPMTGHQGPVLGVAFSPDGRHIASGSWDKTVRVWDAATGQPLGQPLTGHTGPVWSVAFDPDGHRIASASTDTTVRLWPAPDPLTWRDTLCAKITHNMSHQQWREWVSPAIDYLEICPGLPISPDATG